MNIRLGAHAEFVKQNDRSRSEISNPRAIYIAKSNVVSVACPLSVWKIERVNL